MFNAFFLVLDLSFPVLLLKLLWCKWSHPGTRFPTLGAVSDTRVCWRKWLSCIVLRSKRQCPAYRRWCICWNMCPQIKFIPKSSECKYSWASHLNIGTATKKRDIMSLRHGSLSLFRPSALFTHLYDYFLTGTRIFYFHLLYFDLSSTPPYIHYNVFLRSSFNPFLRSLEKHTHIHTDAQRESHWISILKP